MENTIGQNINNIDEYKYFKILLDKQFNKNLFIDYISRGDSNRRHLYETELRQIIIESLDIINPVGYYIENKKGRDTFFYCIVTLGKEVDKQIDRYFNEKEYLKGYYLSCLCDWILYNASDELYKIIKEKYNKKSINISPRCNLESKEELKFQKKIVSLLNREYDTNIELTSKYMVTPLKTLIYYYRAGTHINNSMIDHSCNSCNNKCDNRKVNIIIINDDKKVIKSEKGVNLLTLLQRNGININADCGGKRSCGKCKFKIIEYTDNIDISDSERKLLTDSEINNNIRLACCWHVEQDIVIEIINNGLIENDALDSNMEYLEIDKYYKSNKYDIAIDLGTTTISMSLISNENNYVIANYKYINPQKIFGSDIISRIEYSIYDKDKLITKTIIESIDSKIKAFLKTNNFSNDLIDRIIISGNTTMIYLLLNINPASLARSPYTVEETDIINLSYKELFSSNVLNNVNVVIMPWSSAFIGGDIVSGLYYSNLVTKDNVLFIDIGTNGEMTLIKNGKIYATASAAGPAFEGANIKCGIGSINGAIYKVEKIDNMYSFSTLGEKNPIGICGTGLIDLVSCLINDDKINSEGKIVDDNKYVIYKSKEIDIVLYQEDIRELQLAKAAIATGIQLLCRQAGIIYDDISELYIAGGFGSYLNLNNAITIGLIPKELKDRVKVIGNSSIGGAIKYSFDKEGDQKIREIKNSIISIDLNSIDEFNNLFIQNINFL
jgi:uncharacterized 2Fe-2S/4Fe-4S cluster protein (DUF4445 family)